MRAGAKTAKRRLPKTWASTHGSASTGTARTSRGRASPGNAFPFTKTPAQKAKEAQQQELERGLEVYTHKSPAGPPHVAGSNFLNPLCKPSSSSQTLDQPLLPDGSTSRGKLARLRTPVLAYTANYDEAAELLSCLGPGPMGLDLEWNFSRKGAQRTALLQICSPSMILIIHLSAMSHRIPPPLRSILQDPNIIKTGVAIRNDALKLQRDYSIDTRNVVELGTLAKLAQPGRWADVRRLISLRDLTRVYLGRKLRKDSVRVSDWEQYPLNANQIEYAASDTFVSLEVLRALAEYFKPSGKVEGEQQREGLLEQLDRIMQAGDDPPMDLEQALKLSAYDLYQERVGMHSLATQKRDQMRPALREVQPQAQTRSTSPSRVSFGQTTKSQTNSRSIKPSSSGGKQEANQDSEDDDFITVTSVRLAHDRAMHQWLYSHRTLDQVAQSANVKATTIANYLLKAMVQAKEKGDKANDGQRGLLDDFSPADRERLEAQLKQAGSVFYVHWRRYRMLAKQLGWIDASGSESEGERQKATNAQPAKGTASAGQPNGKTAWQRPAALRPPPAQERSRPRLVVELSDDEVDVNDTSR
ncbi:hypothetical protein EX895_006340 [Sporisorium graminicola]|uniref:3'-5' exonuclease n=1 Tax=Sporisorium graminicola TaxID=280036 RepID=A0A4U7KLZ5_9BASI|nr:hypothetical protein EX895_006340 [Sporisorium graminicola]TKY85260.1 hypothetical protein EX895_006340 [Sporisorium graminicola]